MHCLFLKQAKHDTKATMMFSQFVMQLQTVAVGAILTEHGIHLCN